MSNAGLSTRRIVFDGVIFQLFGTGIARLWTSLLAEWQGGEFAERLTIIDRAATAPRVAGPRYVNAPAYDYANNHRDSALLQGICDLEEAGVFISSYYTIPLQTPSVLLAYDFIPERLHSDMHAPPWREKQIAVAHAHNFVCISQSTANDLQTYYPFVAADRVSVAYPGVGAAFSQASPEVVNAWRRDHGVTKPYFLLSGERRGLENYKNASLFFKALATLHDRHDYAVVCTGGRPELEAEFRDWIDGVEVHLLQLGDLDLRSAYAGALALVYPSRCEGFGLPVLEALACGCPAITCFNTSIPEVAGDAAYYVDPDDVDACAIALTKVQQPSVREPLISRGLDVASGFRWESMAHRLARVLTDAADRSPSANAGAWKVMRSLQAGYQAEIEALKAESYARLIDMQRAEHQRDFERRRIDAIESTKFWKLRASWLRTKNAGLRLLGRSAN